MGAYIENESSIIDGTKDCLAFDNGKMIEVWDTDAECHFGTLPRGFTAEQINAVMKFHDRGYDRGYKHGRMDMRGEFRRLLGIQEIAPSPEL